MTVELKPADKPAMASIVAGEMPCLLGVVMCINWIKDEEEAGRSSDCRWRFRDRGSCRKGRLHQDNIVQLARCNTIAIGFLLGREEWLHLRL